MSLTCVSCYYQVRNKHDVKYNNWFKNTLAINCPYVFFTNKDSIETIKSFRKDLPTYYIECDIEDFKTYNHKDKMITESTHCPSIELNLIWNEKIFMIQKAYELNPFNSDWFKWIDAGICIYRNSEPPNCLFPFNENKLNNLPKDKFIYSSSESEYYNNDLVSITNYYHHISGTSYILHKECINKFVLLYITYLDKLIDKNNIWTDQVVLTHIYKENPDIFFKLTDGYGEITRYLYS